MKKINFIIMFLIPFFAYSECFDFVSRGDLPKKVFEVLDSGESILGISKLESVYPLYFISYTGKGIVEFNELDIAD